MSFDSVFYEMKKRGYRFSMMILDLNIAKKYVGSWADNISMNGTVLVPMWILREEADGSCTVVPGSEPDPTSEPVTIPKDAIKGILWVPKEAKP